jgi:CRP-like cAMP-binding protein
LALDDTIALLKKVPLIGRFDPDALRLLAFSAETRPLRDEEVLFSRGDRSDGGYVVLSGTIGIAPGPDEPEIVIGPGSLIGQVALFARIDRPATATARGAAEVLRISPTMIRRVLAEFPAAAQGMRDAMAADLQGLTADLTRMGDRLLAIGRN